MKPIQDYTRKELTTLALVLFSAENEMQPYFESEIAKGHTFGAEEYCAKVVDFVMKTVEPLRKPQQEETFGTKMLRDGTM